MEPLQENIPKVQLLSLAQFVQNIVVTYPRSLFLQASF